MSKKQSGTVKFFKEDKNWGFITPAAGKGDIFFHGSAVNGGPLNEGDQVEYNIGAGKKGECAVDVEAV